MIGPVLSTVPALSLLALVLGISRADAYTNLHFGSGFAGEYDNVPTVRIEIPRPARAGLQGASISRTIIIRNGRMEKYCS